MRNPYLVARAKIEDRNFKSGIDSIINIDYMGAAEYEFGAIPKSLDRIRESLSKYVKTQYKFKGTEIELTVFCKSDDVQYIEDFLEGLASRKYHTKCYSNIPELINPDPKWPINTKFWWDIENDWMYWIPTEGFDAKFDEKIKPKAN